MVDVATLPLPINVKFSTRHAIDVDTKAILIRCTRMKALLPMHLPTGAELQAKTDRTAEDNVVEEEGTNQDKRMPSRHKG